MSSEIVQCSSLVFYFESQSEDFFEHTLFWRNLYLIAGKHNYSEIRWAPSLPCIQKYSLRL